MLALGAPKWEVARPRFYFLCVDCLWCGCMSLTLVVAGCVWEALRQALVRLSVSTGRLHWVSWSLSGVGWWRFCQASLGDWRLDRCHKPIGVTSLFRVSWKFLALDCYGLCEVAWLGCSLCISSICHLCLNAFDLGLIACLSSGQTGLSGLTGIIWSDWPD